MGKVVYTKISSSENEIVFMTDVVNFILSLDPRITCDTTVADAYAEGTPTFNFSIGGVVTLSMVRSADISGKALEFNFTCGSTTANTIYFSNNWRNGSVSQNMYREWNIACIVTDTLIFFMLGGCTAGDYYNRNMCISLITSDSKHYLNIASFQTYGRSNIFNIADSGRVYTEVETSTTGSFLSRFAYKAPAGQTDYIANSICMNNGSKVFTIDSVYDCTEVIPGNMVSLTDGSYVAIGTHQLVKIA